MKVLRAGSGVAGGFIGSRLVERNECDVTFVVRQNRKVQLMTRGLHLRSQYGQFRRPVRAITINEIGETFDAVVAAVRSQELDAVMVRLVPAFEPQTIFMPVVEGVAHLEPNALASSQRTIVAVLEARLLLDADQILSQRPPVAELSIGALNDGDGSVAADLVKKFAGRGLRTTLCDRICGKTFERFAYMCAAIAPSHLMRHPLRDAIRLAYGQGNLDALLKEALAVGKAAGFAPDELRVKAYSRAFLTVGRPVDVPPGIDDEGRAGEEAANLLAELIKLARRFCVRTPRFDSAWQSVARPRVIEGSATVVLDKV
jgi:2-dehydropantoate 2-reductase